jgi:hypothetical protein
VKDKNKLTKMDTYCIIEIGNESSKTQKCNNAGKCPVWN